MKIKNRFAPSPTGYLHIGVVRTALFNWLFAKKHGGEFVLRIEDTDQERSTEEAVQVIFDGLKWLGLDYDGDAIFQMQRVDRYKEVIENLLAEDKAYKCYCSKERLEKLREEQLEKKEKPRYDGHCRDQNLDKDEPFVIRFRNPLEGEVSFCDLIHGKITVQNSELDDVILVRSDGVPTYNFSVVIDDLDMEISHVIRGDDHINNTPRQINIMQALGKTPPLYAHVPMILGPDGKKLSKRHGAVSVLEFRKDGYLPQALLNYLVRLGWSHGDDEIFSLTDMIRDFNMDNVNNSAAAVNPEKLDWLNHHYIKTLPTVEVAEELEWQFDFIGINKKNGPDLEDLLVLVRDKYKTLRDLALNCQYFYEDEVKYNKESVDKFVKSDTAKILKIVFSDLDMLNPWSEEKINDLIKEVVKENNLKFPQVAQPLRIAVTGDTNSPSIAATLQLLGREKTLTRINKAIGEWS